MNWLITGGCGFIGTSLIQRLLSDTPNTNIRILDNLSVGTKEDLKKVCDYNEINRTDIKQKADGVELIISDIKNKEACLGSCQEIDVVVHLAANTGVAPSVEDPRSDMVTNVVGIFNMLEAARLNQVNKFVFASSGASVGLVGPPIIEDKAPKPVSPYGASKLAGEGYCSAYYQTFGIKTTSLRFGNVYGPRSKNKNSVVAKFIKQGLRGETLEIYGDGTQTRDFIFIDDLIDSIILSVNAEVGGEIFQIATNRETTVNEVANYIVKFMNELTGKDVHVFHGPERPGEVKRNFSDVSKAKRFLKWEAHYTLEQGLIATIKHFLEER